MYFKIYHHEQGPHTFLRIFAGPDWEHMGLAGNLTFRNQEYQWFMRLLCAGLESNEHLLLEHDTAWPNVDVCIKTGRRLD